MRARHGSPVLASESYCPLRHLRKWGGRAGQASFVARAKRAGRSFGPASRVEWINRTYITGTRRARRGVWARAGTQ